MDGRAFASHCLKGLAGGLVGKGNDTSSELEYTKDERGVGFFGLIALRRAAHRMGLTAGVA